MLPEPTPTPGRDRVVRFEIAGRAFGFRRPSRADERDIAGRFAVLTSPMTGLAAEQDTLMRWDGDNRLWDARFEICLVPRTVEGKRLDLGECAPSNWLRDGKITFDNVEPEEFAAVAEYVHEAVFKKKASGQPSDSTVSAAA